jgi:hypothetical protein
LSVKPENAQHVAALSFRIRPPHLSILQACSLVDILQQFKFVRAALEYAGDGKRMGDRAVFRLKNVANVKVEQNYHI